MKKFNTCYLLLSTISLMHGADNTISQADLAASSSLNKPSKADLQDMLRNQQQQMQELLKLNQELQKNLQQTTTEVIKLTAAVQEAQSTTRTRFDFSQPEHRSHLLPS